MICIVKTLIWLGWCPGSSGAQHRAQFSLVLSYSPIFFSLTLSTLLNGQVMSSWEYITSQPIQEFHGVGLKKLKCRIQWWSNEIHYLCEDGIEKSVPCLIPRFTSLLDETLNHGPFPVGGMVAQWLSGRVCLTRDWEAAGSSLTGVTAMWSLSKTHLS